MEYFEVIVDGCSAVYQEVDQLGLMRFTDGEGNTIPAPEEPIRYVLRSFCIDRPAWMESMPEGY